MPALEPTDIIGRVAWLGVVPARDLALASCPRESLKLTFAGPEGEDHSGLTRPSCSRVMSQYPRGTQIRNVRQLSVVSSEELAEIAAKMGLGSFDPAWAGATLVLEGLPDLSHLPPSSRLQIAGEATLVVDMQNRPCHLPAAVIEGEHPGKGRKFKNAARGLRGVTAWVEREGNVCIGDKVALHIPSQRAWKGADWHPHAYRSGECQTRKHGEREAGDEADVDEEAGGSHDLSFGGIGGLVPIKISFYCTRNN